MFGLHIHSYKDCDSHVQAAFYRLWNESGWNGRHDVEEQNLAATTIMTISELGLIQE